MARYDLNDLQSDLDHMGHLVDTIADLMANDCPYVVPGTEQRLPTVDRLNGLIWIAREQMEMLNKLVEDHFMDIGSAVGGKK